MLYSIVIIIIVSIFIMIYSPFIGLSFLLSSVGYLLAVVIHELGHWAVTMYYCKSLNYSCQIKLFSLSKDFEPHTESEYYSYLEHNRSDKNIQRIIRNIAIAGYCSSFACLLLLLIVSLTLFFVFGLEFFMLTSLFIILFISLDVWFCLHSSDRQAVKDPANFYYKYKS